MTQLTIPGYDDWKTRDTAQCAHGVGVNARCLPCTHDGIDEREADELLRDPVAYEAGGEDSWDSAGAEPPF